LDLVSLLGEKAFVTAVFKSEVIIFEKPSYYPVSQIYLLIRPFLIIN
jgi:hypothetical protein